MTSYFKKSSFKIIALVKNKRIRKFIQLISSNQRDLILFQKNKFINVLQLNKFINKSNESIAKAT